MEVHISMKLLLVFVLLGAGVGVLGQRGGCGVPNTQPTAYHAPARFVQNPQVDSALKREFLLLFHREGNPSHSHVNPHDNVTSSSQSPIDPQIIAQINALCSRDSLFYSFSPRHQMAIQLLQQVFMQQRSARDLPNLSRQELSRHEINPRVWYYALLATFLMRPDLNGYTLAGPIDATPDLYVPWTLIRHAISKSTSRPLPNPETDTCTTAIGVVSNDVRFPEPPGAPGRGGQSQPSSGRGGQPQQSQGRGGQFQSSQGRGGQFQSSQGRGGQFQTSQGRGGQFQQNSGRGLQFDQPIPARSIQFQSSPDRAYLLQSFPSQRVVENEFSDFLNFRAPRRVRRQTGRRSQGGSRNQNGRRQQEPECILFNGTNGAPGAENLLWYFREDVQVNEHHWFWHQYFPQSSVRHPDRRGENFFFMHHNILARYNAERLSNGLPREREISLRFNENIGPGYFSDLNDRQSGRFWTPRADNMPLSDIEHGADPDFQLNITVAEISNLYNTVISHVSQGFLIANRSQQAGQPATESQIEILSEQGINHFGNTLEAAEELSVHVNLYNNFGVHNLGHVAIALATDPDFRCRRPTGVMADASVTMRDPAFYKIHSLVDNIFDRSKTTLPPYQVQGGDWPLMWRGVEIRNIEVLIPALPRNRNIIQTFWQIKSFPLDEGIDGSIHDGDIDAQICQQHLNHETFQFRITVDVDSCAETRSGRGTMRLFMAPRFDLDGRRFTMEETRMLMFQLDVFPVELRRGRNIITRNSADSSSTRSWSRSLAEMLRDPNNAGRVENCGCGWPQHLYIPKGTQQGMQFDLFAMVTNYDQDQVQDTAEDLRIPEPCNSAYLFCGIPYRRYPDRRPMNYPFDRRTQQLNSLEQFVAPVPNMASNVITIRHINQVLQ